MTIQFSKKKNVLLATIAGEIDHHTAESIRGKMEQEAFRTGIFTMVVDFSEVEFMDSSGIGMIIGRYKFLQNMGGTMLLAGAAGNIDRIFSLSGLYKIVKNYETVELALQAAEGGKNNGV